MSHLFGDKHVENSRENILGQGMDVQWRRYSNLALQGIIVGRTKITSKLSPKNASGSGVIPVRFCRASGISRRRIFVLSEEHVAVRKAAVAGETKLFL